MDSLTTLKSIFHSEATNKIITNDEEKKTR